MNLFRCTKGQVVVHKSTNVKMHFFDPKMKMEHQPSNHGNRQTAQGMVEFALSLPIILVLIFGIIEGGRLMFTYSALASASREAARYAAGIGNTTSGMSMYNDCMGIRDAAKRIGFFAGIVDEDIQIFSDSGPGTVTTEYCNPSSPTSLSQGDRIIIEIDKDYTVVAPLVPIPPMTLHTENAHTLLEGAEIEAKQPPIPPGTSLVCDMTPYYIYHESNPVGPIDTVDIKNTSGSATTIKNILLIWEGTGGPVLLSIGDPNPGPGSGVNNINSTGPSFSENIEWEFPEGHSSFDITFSKELKSRVIIRLTLAGENNCAFGN